MAWRVLLYEDMGPPDRWEPWSQAMAEVDPKLPAAAVEYRRVTDGHWEYYPHDNPDPYKEVRQWAERQPKYARVRSQLESFTESLVSKTASGSDSSE
jgi:hypothetical protein